MTVNQCVEESKNWHAVKTNNISLLWTCKDEAEYQYPIDKDSALADMLQSWNAHKRFSFQLYSRVAAIVEKNLKAIEG